MSLIPANKWQEFFFADTLYASYGLSANWG